jgi:hypothetical protein
MALQLSQIDFTQFRAQDASNDKRQRYGMYTGPVSYSNFFTNSGTGDPVIPGDLGLGAIHQLNFEAAVNISGVFYTLVYLTPNQIPLLVNGGIIWYVGTTGLEAANGTNLSGYSSYFAAVGY